MSGVVRPFLSACINFFKHYRGNDAQSDSLIDDSDLMMHHETSLMIIFSKGTINCGQQQYRPSYTLFIVPQFYSPKRLFLGFKITAVVDFDNSIGKHWMQFQDVPQTRKQNGFHIFNCVSTPQPI